MRYITLAIAIFSMSLRRNLTFRMNLLFEGLVSVVGVATSLATLRIVYTWTDTLGGWSHGEAVVLFGTWQVMGGVLWTFIEPNVGWFRDQVVDGKLDEILLKPIPSIVLASLGTCAPFGLIQIATGSVVLMIGLNNLGGMPSARNILAWLLLFVIGIIVTWASRILLACLAFWAPSFQPDVLYKAIWQFGRYPVSIYRQPVRFALTFVLPMAFIATLPTQALTQGISPLLLAIGLGCGFGAILLANTVWNAGLRRYTSATS